MTTTFVKETLVAGRPTTITCLEVAGQTYSLSNGPLGVVRLEDEWFDDVKDPETAIVALKESWRRPDIFTFWQRLPDCEPRFDFFRVWETIAVLPVLGFRHWWDSQIKPATRNLVRKAERKGVEVREVVYDDDFVRGMTEIFNETPIRQGRRFWHYGKDFETIKSQFSRYLFRETLIGAYHDGELIGFLMLGNAGRYGDVGQIISKIRHRDKSPNNALIAKAVAVCESKRLPYLVYAYWTDGPLADFKRHNGFEAVSLPRYYVPLTRRGRLALALRLHAGLKDVVPQPLRNRLRALRRRWFSVVHG